MKHFFVIGLIVCGFAVIGIAAAINYNPLSGKIEKWDLFDSRGKLFGHVQIDIGKMDSFSIHRWQVVRVYDVQCIVSANDADAAEALCDLGNGFGASRPIPSDKTFVRACVLETVGAKPAFGYLDLHPRNRDASILLYLDLAHMTGKWGNDYHANEDLDRYSGQAVFVPALQPN
jgi:hypothetical protein